MIRIFLFPEKLRRSEYFWRFLLFKIFDYWANFSFEATFSTKDYNFQFWLLVFTYLALLVYFIVFAAVPRARDAGLPKWIWILLVIPYLSLIAGLGLMFVRSRLFKSEFKENTAEQDAAANP